jgi:hypothetical protein
MASQLKVSGLSESSFFFSDTFKIPLITLDLELIVSLLKLHNYMPIRSEVKTPEFDPQLGE